MDDSSNSSLPSAVFPAGSAKLPMKAMKALSVREDSFSRQSDFDAVDAVIMMVDDELLNIEMTQAFLEEAGYRRFAATHESELAIEMMQLRPPHVLLLDLSMPKVGGMEILEQMRDDEKLRHIPVIVLTSNADAQTKLRALALGAMDFLAKPVDPSELALRLRNTLAATAYRDYLANHDPLTGLRNRPRYLLEVEAALLTAADRGHGCALLHMGVDRLSQINDAMGRAAGDTLLQRMAKRLRQCVESAQGGELGQFETQHPSLYRFDGDEFAILVPFLDEIESAAGFITSLLEAAATSLRVDSREMFVTASLGIAVFPLDGRTPDDLVKNAGLAMRHAKQTGRNTYEFFSPELNQQAVSALHIGGDIRRALTRDELSMLYQPKINVSTGRLMGAETVLRWARPDGSVVEGNQVIQMAGTSEMGMVLAEWMFEQVGKQTRAWQAAGLAVVPFGINLSLRQFPLPQLMEIVSAALKANAQPAHLCLELSALSALDDPATSAHVTGKFKEWGLRVALDHFGTTDATLSHLNGLSIHEIKADPVFMFKIEENKTNAAIMRGMIDLAKRLGITLVATGVQTLHQLAFLKDNGADQCQGRLFNNPLPAEEFAAKWLEPARR
ncbi:MAG: EAL domain-containing protein [Burkholderiales bacterium]|nr:EAL domain-containing protein [Burkholderiales bacterium]